MDRLRLAFDLLGVAGLFVTVRVHQIAGLAIVFVAVLGHTVISLRERWRDE